MVQRRGVSYPLQIVNGSLRVSEDYDLIREAIASVLETRQLERVLRPDYGTPDFVFSTVSRNGAIAERMQLSLEQQIDDAECRVIGRASESGDYYARVEWAAGEIPQPPIEYRLSR